MESISSYVCCLAESFASSMKSSFEQLDSRIVEKLANVTSLSNRSLSGSPSQAPIQQSPCQGRPDPSFLTPRTRYGHLGGEQRESEPAELANFPSIYMSNRSFQVFPPRPRSNSPLAKDARIPPFLPPVRGMDTSGENKESRSLRCWLNFPH